MLRTALMSAGATLLAASLLTAAPAPSQAATYKPYGYAKSADLKVRHGCHRYSFRYRVKPPTSEWAAEFFVTGPGGKALLSDVVLAESDPKKNKRPWSTEICSQSAPSGRYKIRMKVTWNTSIRETKSAWVKPTYFHIKRL